MSRKQCENIHSVIENSVPPEYKDDVIKLLYGEESQVIPLTKEAEELSKKNDFEIRAFKMKESAGNKRIVRVAGIQHPIVLPTTEPIDKQYQAIQDKVDQLIAGAAAMGANIVCLQEAWTCPFFFCTREKVPWMEFAEPAKTGRSTMHLKTLAKKYNMVIISSILEIDETHADTIWNTAVIISNSGEYLGKTRKYHIPRVGDFNESTYYFEGNMGQQVFETEFGKIGVNICYGRHFPQHWHMLSLNGAEMIFNPSATVDGLSEPLWSIEARNAAIANGVYTIGINRVGTETFPNEYTSGDGKPAHHDFGHFYGSTYVTGPSGQRTPPLSRTKAGVLISEIDLNLNKQIRHSWNFHMCARWEDYVKMYSEQVKIDYVQPIIRDPYLDAKK